jgi:hypothetical protein
MEFIKEFLSVDDLVTDAKECIDNIHKTKNAFEKPPVAVFDIDSTLIFYYGHNLPTIPRTKIIELHNWIKTSYPAIEIIYLTGRQNGFGYPEQTVYSLINAGCDIELGDNFPKVIMMDMMTTYMRSLLVGNYKHKARKEILSEKTIILNIGDRWTDLTQDTIETSNYSDFCKVKTPDSLLSYKLSEKHDIDSVSNFKIKMI